MNILEQIQPKSRVSAQKIQSIKKEIIEVKKPIEQITSYIDLDSMTKIESKSVRDEIIQLQKTEDIYSISSYCNSYISFQKQLNFLDEKYKTKFSSELEYVLYQSNMNYNKQIIDYLSRTYDKINFKLEVMYELDFDKKNINIEDSLYFKDNIIIIPEWYQYIISDLVQALDINKQIMIIKGTRIVPLEINPMRRIKNSQINIDQKNSQWCNRCEFYSICDQKSI